MLNCSSQKGAGVRGWAVMQEAKNARKGKRAEREGEVCGGGVSADTLTANSVSSTEDARPSQVTDVEGTCERCLQGSQESALQTGPP